MKNPSVLTFTLLILLSLFLTGCGYYWGHGQRSLPKGYKTVFIEIFENRTNEVGTEVFFTQALTEEFRRSGFAHVTDRSRAEVILKGVLLSVTYQGTTIVQGFKDQSNELIQSATLFGDYNVNVTASLKLVTAVDNKVLWRNTLRGLKTYRGPQLKTYGVRSSNPLYNQGSREQTLKSVAKDMMNDAFHRMTENF